MTCKHPNVTLTISWTIDMTSNGPEVIRQPGPASNLRVVATCSDCSLTGNVFTNVDGWEDRWPNWLIVRVRQLANSNASLRLAVRTCMPGLITDTD